MIKALDDMPQGILGFEASGKVTEDDYRNVLLPPVREALEGGKARILFVFGDDYDGYSAGAMWEDTKLGVGHLRGWEKTALVTSHTVLADFSRAFAWLFPGEARVFLPEQIDQAKAWLAAE